MTKLLQIMAGAKVGGAEKFFERLAIAFENAGIKQRVAIRQNNDRTALLREAGIQPFEYRFGGILDLTTQRKIQNLTDDFEPDIILAWMSRGAQYLPKKVSQNCIRVARLGGYYNLKYFKKCDYLIGNTEDICTYLKNEGWPAEKVVYLPNFVDDTLAPPIDRSQFNTPESVPLLLGLGRLHENKAFDTGIKALVDIPNAYYWIAGEGPRRQELMDLAEKLGVSERVKFLGWRNDVA
ncbi:MAG: glycosyltransferase, partial [Alphaproteobacteria bacterium]|nr:glycosyltransferase [Alphaproteobacteria bacterium]